MTMQNKVINFSNYIADLLEKYVPPTEDKEVYITKIREGFKNEEEFNRFYFAVVPALCKSEQTKGTIQTLRSIKDDDKVATESIEKIKRALSLVNTITGSMLEIPEEEFLRIITRISLYVNCFTDMYV